MELFREGVLEFPKHLPLYVSALSAAEKNKEGKGIVLMYGFNHRYHESVQDTLHILNSGEFGKIINMRGVYGKAKLITFNQPDWRTKRDIAGGGVLLEPDTEGYGIQDTVLKVDGSGKEYLIQRAGGSHRRRRETGVNFGAGKRG